MKPAMSKIVQFRICINDDGQNGNETSLFIVGIMYGVRMICTALFEVHGDCIRILLNLTIVVLDYQWQVCSAVTAVYCHEYHTNLAQIHWILTGACC